MSMDYSYSEDGGLFSIYCTNSYFPFFTKLAMPVMVV